MIIDPAINDADNYKAYQDGIKEGIFIKVCESGKLSVTANYCSNRNSYVLEFTASHMLAIYITSKYLWAEAFGGVGWAYSSLKSY